MDELKFLQAMYYDLKHHIKQIEKRIEKLKKDVGRKSSQDGQCESKITFK